MNNKEREQLLEFFKGKGYSSEILTEAINSARVANPATVIQVFAQVNNLEFEKLLTEYNEAYPSEPRTPLSETQKEVLEKLLSYQQQTQVTPAIERLIKAFKMRQDTEEGLNQIGAEAFINVAERLHIVAGISRETILQLEKEYGELYPQESNLPL